MRTLLSVVLLIPALSAGVLAAEPPGMPQDVSGTTPMVNAHGQKIEVSFKLYDPGTEVFVDYEKYGTFVGEGTDKYQYRITNRKGLSAAVGEGVYPSNAVYKDPTYRMLVSKGKLGGTQWDYVNIEDQQLAFYKWATSHDTMAVQQYYTALALEKLGAIEQAIKAYHAVVVHFPGQVGWTVFRTPLYMGKLSIDRIHYLCRKHAELGIALEGAEIRIKNGFDFDTNNDVFYVNPGRLVKVDPETLRLKKTDLSRLKITQSIGNDAVKLVRYENGHWQLRVDGKPFMIQAVAYSPSPVGKSPHEGYNLDSWMITDLNGNGRIDGPLEAWVDKNNNNIQDADEPTVGDFQLMKEMGVNTIRIYHHPMNKEILREAYEKYGIRFILGDLLGMYAVGSGADWFKGTDYTDPAQKEKMKESVRKLVNEHKDEPYVLMWMLGNESNYGEPGDPAKDKVGFGSQAKHQTEAHYGFINEVALMIKQMDPDSIVAFSNGETVTIDAFGRLCPDVDVFGTNSYRGRTGFGQSLWKDAKEHTDKPVLITEYGCPAYYSGKDLDYAEQTQMDYHRGNWQDISDNSAGNGPWGNAIGGVAFEFVDEWWKAGPPPKFSPFVHEAVGDFKANFPDGWMYEEWLGLTHQGDGSQSPYLRRLRKVYNYYKEVWNAA